MPWKAWKPEFDGHKTLREVLATMPRDPPSKVPWQIRLFENPNSLLSMPGAIGLHRHDCLHALLCTSFYSECEAWTIGFTMGTCARPPVRKWQLWLFKTWAKYAYPGNYKFDKKDEEHFDEGFETGKFCTVNDIHHFPFELFMDITLGEFRKRLGLAWIDSDEAYQQWATERWNDKPDMHK